MFSLIGRHMQWISGASYVYNSTLGWHVDLGEFYIDSRVMAEMKCHEPNSTEGLTLWQAGESKT